MTINTSPQTVSGRYQMLHRLGAGSMGIVYRALDKLNRQLVALKRVTLSDDPRPPDAIDARLALAGEFQTLASLRHPHIISVLDFGFDERRRPYFTMDLLLEPKSLLIAGRTMSLAGKVDLLVQTLQALAYLHRRGILHRDLKPGNVLVVGGQVKVLDFGLSIEVVPVEGIVGTPAYMAPELLQGESAAPTSDLYALGVMAYELIAGRHPFNTGTIRRLISDVINVEPDMGPLERSLETHATSTEPPPTLPELDAPTDPASPLAMTQRSGIPEQPRTMVHTDVPPAQTPSNRPVDAGTTREEHPLTAIVRKLLDKNPRNRYSDATTVIHALSAASGIPLPVETAATRESFLQAAQFVGRETEFAQLTTALNQAMAGRGSAWLIGGESGVGKSRLLNEVRIHALVAGALVLHGQAVGSPGNPYHIWSEPLRRLTLITDLNDTDAGILKAIAPDIGDLLGRKVGTAPELDPELAQRRLTSVVASVFHRQALPVVLILEDLHWVGSESLSVLQQISQAARSLPLLILASYRDDESPSLPNQLVDLQVLKLHRLNQPAIAALSESMLGDAGRQPQVLDLLQRETEGNVYFLVEVVRTLAEEAGQLDKIGTMPLPAHVFAGGVLQIVQRRLEGVPPNARPLLQLAAVLGRQLDLRVLGAAAPNYNLETWLAACHEAAVLEFQDGQWQFAHDKLREGVLAAIAPDARSVLHRQAALAIEKTAPDRVIALAHHWRAAGDAARELHYAVLAGEQADRVSAFQEAIEHFRRALTLLGSSTQTRSQRAPLLVQLGRVYARLNSHAEAGRLLNEGLAAATQIADREVQADALVWLGNVARAQGSLDQAARYYEDSLNISYEIADRRAMADALRGLARIAAARGQYTEANRRFEESLAISREIADRWGTAHALSDLALVASMQGAHAEASQRLEESLALFTALGDRRGMAKSLLNLGMVAQYQGLPAEGIQYWEQSLAVSREIGDQWSVGATLNNLGYAAFLRGNYAQAETYLEESLDIFRTVGDPASAVQTLVNLGHVASALGDDFVAAERYRAALQSSLEIDAVPTILEIMAGIARLHAKAGRVELAAELVGLTLHHPGNNSDIRGIAEPLLAELRDCLPSGELQAALERGQARDLKEVAATVLEDNLPH